MSRRALTLLLAIGLALVLGVGAAVAPVPYVELEPGPTFNTLGTENNRPDGTPVIVITGRQTYPDEGHLDLTTVGVQPRLTLSQALRGWFDRDVAVVPREIVYPPDQTDEQVDRANTEQMVQSQSSATTAALTSLRIPSQVVVAQVSASAPATGKLKEGDVLTSVDGTAVTGSAQLRDLISSRTPGSAVRVGYTRAGTAGVAVIATGRAEGEPQRAVIGVGPQDRFPVQVKINLEEVGGPSAGLMFALGIIDKLEPGSLTGGRYVAGTGTMADDGAVGPIGGIAQKLIAARKKGATVFLTPAADCGEALGNVPDGLQLVRVGSLSEALAGLSTLRAGGTPPTCTR